MTRSDIIFLTIFVAIIVALLLLSVFFNLDITTKLKNGGIALSLGICLISLIKRIFLKTKK